MSEKKLKGKAERFTKKIRRLEGLGVNTSKLRWLEYEEIFSSLAVRSNDIKRVTSFLTFDLQNSILRAHKTYVKHLPKTDQRIVPECQKLTVREPSRHYSDDELDAMCSLMKIESVK